MGLFTSINIAATGMSVERLRTDVIANNIANASTTRTPEGGKFQRQTVSSTPSSLYPHKGISTARSSLLQYPNYSSTAH